jgi:hypothetical protein
MNTLRGVYSGTFMVFSEDDIFIFINAKTKEEATKIFEDEYGEKPLKALTVLEHIRSKCISEESFNKIFGSYIENRTSN